MTKFRVNFSLLTAAALCAAVVSGCTKVDDKLGANLVPGNQQMHVFVKNDFPQIKTHLYRTDGVASSRTGTGWFGRAKDATFGRQTHGMVLQFEPITVPYSKVEGYGLEPIVDSAMIMLALKDLRGGADSVNLQTFEVWDMDGDKLSRDSVYYSDFDVPKKNLLFTFTHKGRRDVKARLKPTAEGRKYLDSIVRLSDWDYYVTDTLFRKKFQGLFIRPVGDVDGAVYGANLASSGLTLHVRNHDTLDVKAIYDTLTTVFTFRDVDAAATSTSSAQAYDNVSINLSSFDYSGGVLEGVSLTDTLPSSPSIAGPLYVQSGGGVGTMLRFTKEFVDAVKALKVDGKDIMINQAMLTLPVKDPSTAGMDASIARIGSYLNFRKLGSIPDYLYSYEVYQQSQSSTSTYKLPYNGYLNRSQGVYELNVTSYVQRLAQDKIHDAIYLGPEAYSVFGQGQTVLAGGEGGVGVRITYTIID